MAADHVAVHRAAAVLAGEVALVVAGGVAVTVGVTVTVTGSADGESLEPQALVRVIVSTAAAASGAARTSRRVRGIEGPPGGSATQCSAAAGRRQNLHRRPAGRLAPRCARGRGALAVRPAAEPP